MWTINIILLLICFSVATTEQCSDVLHVTLRVFSGTPDPIWMIQSRDPHYQQIMTCVEHNQSTPLPPLLGYTGFTIEKYTGGSSTPAATLTVGKCTNTPLETLLVNTVEDLVPVGADQPLGANVIQYVRDQLAACD